MADPCVNARRTRRITARLSHVPKIRVRPLKVPVFAAQNRELAPAVYLTKDATLAPGLRQIVPLLLAEEGKPSQVVASPVL